MNLFSRFLSWFGVGALSNPDEGPQTGVGGGVGTSAGISVADDRAMKVSAVWACVNYIVNSVASLPLNFYEKDPNGRKEITDRHYLTDLFHDKPNSYMKPRDFRKAMTTQLTMWANAYAQIHWSGDRPVALVPLRPGRMTPYLKDGELTYHYQTNQGMIVFAPRSIMHMKGLGSDGIVGYERTSYARETMGLSVSADTYAAKQFANGGRSGGGYMSYDEFLTDKQRIQARKLYEGMSTTAYNKGKLWLLEGGVKYQPDELNPDKMQMIETRGFQLSEIARFWGVPEVLLGAGTQKGAWPASFEQQILSFLTFTLQDYLDEWESTIQYSLIMPKDRTKIFADHDVSGFIKMDSKTKSEVQSRQVQNGIRTRNEVRLKNNDPKKEGGDELTVQVNLTPLDELENVNAAKNRQSAGALPAQTSQ